jgi:hypothetical protein
MGNLKGYQSKCRKILCQTAKRRRTIRRTITYGDLASALDLASPRQQWSTVLNPIYEEEMQNTGRDVTLVVVYASGPARGLSRYFSNGRAPQGTMLDPRNFQQVEDYKKELEKVFDTYAKLAC